MWVDTCTVQYLYCIIQVPVQLHLLVCTFEYMNICTTNLCWLSIFDVGSDVGFLVSGWRMPRRLHILAEFLVVWATIEFRLAVLDEWILVHNYCMLVDPCYSHNVQHLQTARWLCKRYCLLFLSAYFRPHLEVSDPIPSPLRVKLSLYTLSLTLALSPVRPTCL